VKGLQVGAPVDFRGVTLGRVVGIKVQYHSREIRAVTVVVMTFDPGQVEVIGAEATHSPVSNLENS
jgi:ABC-type transporter Mla subunit MlaD